MTEFSFWVQYPFKQQSPFAHRLFSLVSRRKTEKSHVLFFFVIAISYVVQPFRTNLLKLLKEQMSVCDVTRKYIFDDLFSNINPFQCYGICRELSLIPKFSSNWSISGKETINLINTAQNLLSPPCHQISYFCQSNTNESSFLVVFRFAVILNSKQ